MEDLTLKKKKKEHAVRLQTSIIKLLFLLFACLLAFDVTMKMLRWIFVRL